MTRAGAQLHDSQAAPSRQPERNGRALAQLVRPSWLWPAWVRTTNLATLTRKPSACCAAESRFRTDQLGTITITSDGRGWQVARPSLARSGRPTQADVDRVAAATEDDLATAHDANPHPLKRVRARFKLARRSNV